MTEIIQSFNETDILNSDVKFVLENNPEYQKLVANIDEALAESESIVVVSASDVETASFYVANFKKVAKRLEETRVSLTGPLNNKVTEINDFFKSTKALFSDRLEFLNKEILSYNKKVAEEARKKAAAERKAAEDKALAEAIAKEEKLKAEAAERGKKLDAILRDIAKLKGQERLDRALWLCKTQHNILPSQDELNYLAGTVDELTREDIVVEPAIIPEVIVESRKISELNTSKVHTRKTKTIDIVNADLIPREYLIPDEKKIRAERMKYEACNEDGSLVKSTIPGVEFTYSEGVV